MCGNKNAAEWVETNFKDYIEADGNGVNRSVYNNGYG